MCIIDEAGQITLPAVLGALMKAQAFCLVGDHHQLPPLVQNPAAAKQGLGCSLFRRLCEAHPEVGVFPHTSPHEDSPRPQKHSEGLIKVCAGHLLQESWIPIYSSCIQCPYNRSHTRLGQICGRPWRHGSAGCGDSADAVPHVRRHHGPRQRADV